MFKNPFNMTVQQRHLDLSLGITCLRETFSISPPSHPTEKLGKGANFPNILKRNPAFNEGGQKHIAPLSTLAK
jgi:hypothetical protein